MEEEEDEGELFDDNMENDYRPMPELDHYDPAMLNHEYYSKLLHSDRITDAIEMRRHGRAKGIYRYGHYFVFDLSGAEDVGGPRADTCW